MPACVQVLERFKPQEFSSMLWSVAKLGFKLGNNMEADRVFQTASEMDLQRLRYLSVQGLTNVLYAFVEYINGSPSYTEFLGLLVGCILNRFGEFEVIGLLYVVESLHSLLSQSVPVPNLQKLAFLAALEVLKHTKELDPVSLARFVACTGSFNPEMRMTISTLVEAAYTKEDMQVPNPQESQNGRADRGRRRGNGGDGYAATSAGQQSRTLPSAQDALRLADVGAPIRNLQLNLTQQEQLRQLVAQAQAGMKVQVSQCGLTFPGRRPITMQLRT
jgi:hypothetical protein